MLAFKLALEITLLVFLGFFIGKIKLFPENFESALSKLVLDVSLPCLIIVSLNKPFNPSELSGLVTLMIMSFVMTCAFFALGQLGYLAVGRGASGRLIRFGSAFCNYTYFGLPVMEALYGARGLFLYNIFIIPIRILIYFTANVNFSGEIGVKDKKYLIKTIATPPTIAVIIGLVLYLCNITLPAFLAEAMDSIGSVSSPLGMLLCGLALAHIDLKNIFKFPKAFITVGIRGIIAPVLTLFVLLMTNLDPLYIKLAVIYATLPIAAVTSSYVIKYEKDEQAICESAVAILFSTILSIATLPLFSFILDKILG